MKIIGLTGGIASGKSTVSDYLKEKGYKIVDADIVARKVVEPDTIGLSRLVEEFGDDILSFDKSLDRKKLGQIVFNDSQKLKRLNDILHPIIRKFILNEFDYYKKNNEKLIIFDCPLLFEGSYQKLCDETWLVSISYETQIERLIVRDNIDKVHAIKIINSQMLLEDKIKLADIVIDNEGDIKELYIKIDKLLIRNF